MSRLEESKRRLEAALDRLEAVVEGRLKSNGLDAKAQEDLHTARADYAAVKQTTDMVRSRLDDTIHRLEAVLES
ncbi:MAG: hypothetical protein QNJ94_18165 [Alphaproteobacteria bacterium]|nr:hypothetical protein [Alphaproteobacteria bacterium]